MGKVIVRHGTEVAWELHREFEVEGKKRWGIRSKKYLDPVSDGALFRINEYAPRYTERAHSHTADEVIYILEGEVQIGDATYRPGDALFIEANTVYGPLKAGPKGMTFLLVRAAPAAYVAAPQKDSRSA